MAAAMLVALPASRASASSPSLARFPYLTDLTATSVAVNWATSSTDSTPGVATFGVPGACTQHAVPSQHAATSYTAFGETAPYYQHTVQLTGLTPGTTYCYRVYTGATAPATALLDEPPQFPTTFTTSPAPGASTPFSFDVLGDFGETSLTNNAPLGTYNQYQAALDTQLAASASAPTNPALFAISTGDIAYNSGTTTNYGDLNHPADAAGAAAEQSNIFDARYWGKVGSALPLYTVTGNHGRNSTFINTWPSPTNVTGSNGTYTASFPYSAVDGIASGKYPSDWYAFTVGGVRLYILDVDWTDVSPSANPSLGTACASACPSYQVERDEHWQQSSAEYQWLANDLQRDVAARGSSALRMAFFHYPLRVDQNNYTTQQDVYLQNSAANPTGGAISLEALLNRNNVNLVFNGHAHMYERNVAPPGGVPNYVTGGGGAVPTNVAPTSACSSTDAYARGWDPTHAIGSACGAPSDGVAAKPVAAAQVYHFLKVTVSGTNVTVQPTDSGGTVFDPITYQFAPDTTPPSTPGAPTAVRGSGSAAGNVTVTLGTPATDNVGVVSYDIYRDGAYRATIPAGVTKWVDVAVPAGTHAWTTVARDQRGNQSASPSTPSQTITFADTTAPTAPGTPVAQATAATPNSVQLSWTPSTDNVAVTGYNVYRDGTLIIAGVGSAATADVTVHDNTTYSYTVRAVDAAGNLSAPSAATSITTPDWTPPTAPTLSAAGGPPNEIDLSWTGATDSVGVTAYDVYRDAVTTPIATVAGTTWADTALAAGSTHSYTVIARDGAGNSSPPSNTASAKVGSSVVPVGSPTALTVTQLPTPGQVTLSWSAPTKGTAISFAVYRGPLQLWSGSAMSYMDTAAPDSVPGTYTVFAYDGSGNSASAGVTLTPDWTAPTVPGAVRASATSTSSSTITWNASTDAVGVTAYTVTRTDAAGKTTPIATVAAGEPTTATDAAGTPGAAYTYTVTAADAAGNTSTAATASVLLPVFSESFESGTISTPPWTVPTSGLVTQQATVHAGGWAAEETSAGNPTWSSAQLSQTYRALHVTAWVYVKSRGTSAGFLKVRTATGAYIAYLYVNASGYLSVRNDAGNVTHVSTSPVTNNQWHKVELALDTNPGGPISLWAAIDGTRVTFTTPVTSSESLGPNPIGQVVLGDTVAARTYDIAIDDLTADTAIG
jgi:fibronectin type 3 domain-containing protein